MKVENKKNYNLSSGNLSKAILTFLAVIISVLVLLPTSVSAVDTDASYQSFNSTLGSCPRKGQPARDECVLKVAKIYVDKYCVNQTNKDACNEEWRNGYLLWFNKQPNVDALRNAIGDTAIDTSNPACKDRTGAQPAVCTQPYNTESCKDRTGSRPSYCDIPALSTDGTSTGGNTDRKVTGDKVAFESCHSTEECDFVDKFVNPAIKFLSAGVGIIVTIMIIVAGIQYTTAGSDPQKVSAAKGKITNAVIALVTYIFLFALLQWLWPGGII